MQELSRPERFTIAIMNHLLQSDTPVKIIAANKGVQAVIESYVGLLQKYQMPFLFYTSNWPAWQALDEKDIFFQHLFYDFLAVMYGELQNDEMEDKYLKKSYYSWIKLSKSLQKILGSRNSVVSDKVFKINFHLLGGKW